MQLVPRYLVSNRSTIVANEAGFVTEYRPVYSRQLIVYKGIDNVLEFKLLNADQKPIDLSTYSEIKFRAFDESKNLVIEHFGTQSVSSDGSTPIKGLFEVTITDNDTLNLKQQFLSYSIYLVDSNNTNVITYSDSHFGNSGTIKISDEAFPGPKSTDVYTAFFPEGDYWVAGAKPNDATNSDYHISAEPGINGNEALHTAVFYTDGYTGSITIQATLDDQITNGTNWADIEVRSFDGTETQPTPINFYGVFSYLRFKASDDPADKISKILVRN